MYIKMKNALCALCILMICLIADANQAAVDAGQTKIAIVDLGYIIQNATVMINIKNDVDALEKDLSSKVIARELEVKKLKTVLDGMKESDHGFKTTLQKFNQTLKDLREYQQSQKIKIDKAHRDAVDKVHAHVFDIVKHLSDNGKKFEVALPSSQVLFACDSLNVTEFVIQQLNQRIEKINLEIE